MHLVLLLQLLSLVKAELEVVPLHTGGSEVVCLECRDRGTALSESLWFKNNVTLNATSGKLTINPVQPADEGYYTCCNPLHVNMCSTDRPYNLTAPPKLDNSVNLPRPLQVLREDSLQIPCGVEIGEVTLSREIFHICWNVIYSNSNSIAIHCSGRRSQGEELYSDNSNRNLYSFNTTSLNLTIQNFKNFSQSTFKLNCSVTVGVSRQTEVVKTYEMAIVYVAFRIPLRQISAVNRPDVRFSVEVEATRGMPVVSWLVGRQMVNSRGRFSITDSVLNTNFVRSTLTMSNVTDDDTNTKVTAMATLTNVTESTSTTTLINIPVLEGVRIECHCFNDYSCDQLLVSFTLPGSFPSFRRLSHHHDIISMNITFTTISNTAPPITVPLMVGPKEYQDLRNPGIILRREQLRSIHSQERYRVQLLLIVSGKAANDGSPLCSREWNVYPPRFSDCGPDSGLSQGSTKDLEFELVFNEGDCAAMNDGDISSSIFSTVSKFCVDFMNSSKPFTCLNRSVGIFSMTVFSYSLASYAPLVMDRSNYRNLPFDIIAVKDASLTTTTTQPPLTEEDTLEVSGVKEAAIAVVVVVAVLMVILLALVVLVVLKSNLFKKS